MINRNQIAVKVKNCFLKATEALFSLGYPAELLLNIIHGTLFDHRIVPSSVFSWSGDLSNLGKQKKAMILAVYEIKQCIASIGIRTFYQATGNINCLRQSVMFS